MTQVQWIWKTSPELKAAESFLIRFVFEKQCRMGPELRVPVVWCANHHSNSRWSHVKPPSLVEAVCTRGWSKEKSCGATVRKPWLILENLRQLFLLFMQKNDSAQF
jgi:hypothetical protein